MDSISGNRPIMSKNKKAVLNLTKQLRDLKKEPNDYFSVGLIDESNVFNWEVMIFGPRNTLYEGGFFKAHLLFPEDYPYNPPKMRFLTPMWHPNISKDGYVCISILHSPNNHHHTFGYEQACEEWSPVHSVETVVMSVISLLNDPNIESPANVDAAKEYRNDQEAFQKRVRALTLKTLE